MFYSDTLLSKTGPLARVWLASNLERKLSKKECLTTDLGDTVETMVDPHTAPMALRLSGQLLLGVVKIYKRKAAYLLDDCNDALLKIKMAFRPGNVDLPSNESHIAGADALNLPDRITEIDLFAALTDPDLLLSQPLFSSKGGNDDPAILDWGTQSLITDSLEMSSTKQPARLLADDDLELDLGFGEDDLTIEVGRREATPRDDSRNEPTLLQDDGLELDFGDDIQVGDISGLPLADQDVRMDDFGLEDPSAIDTPAPERKRASASPLSSIRSSEDRDLERTFRLNESSLYDQPDEQTTAQQRVKRRKVIQMDAELELPSALIKAQQTDRSKITKLPQYLPRDPVLLALMNMQKSGAFISNIFGDGRSLGWAPELRNILSVDLIRSSSELKRKRDSGIADLSDEDHDKRADEDLIQLTDLDNLPSDSAGPVQGHDSLGMEGDFGPGSPFAPADGFDDTTMPLLHPADAGPISQGTQHAVHLLRQHFGPEGETSPSQRQRSSVLLQDLIPERSTRRTDATKMFFEILVLATKDAIKVEQGHKRIGEPVRIRAKRGLYGAWAEAGESQQMQGQAQEQPPPDEVNDAQIREQTHLQSPLAPTLESVQQVSAAA